MLGGLLHTLYTFVFDSERSYLRRGRLVASRVATGVLAGLLAYLLAAWNVLGIQVDTTSLRAYAIMGFLFSYVGVDALVKKILPGEHEHTETSGSTLRECPAD